MFYRENVKKMMEGSVLGRELVSSAYNAYKMNLIPAQWIWFPSQRTLPNTFVLFRRSIVFTEVPNKVAGWITADSRYRLTVNGQRVQWGPAPGDPRWLDVDPVDLTKFMHAGENVLGVEVLYYGHGEGTWAAGKPGLLCALEIENSEGGRIYLYSDAAWMSYLDRAHRPGQYKRWFLRALQEDFDARQHPHGWDTTNFVPGDAWLPALVISENAAAPASVTAYQDYLTDSRIVDSAETGLLARQIPLLRTMAVPALRLQDAGRVHWQRDPLDWFEFRTPDSFTIVPQSITHGDGSGGWEVAATTDAREAVYLTFEFAEQVVGWPYFTIEAPEGTIVELMCQEGHDPKKTAWLDTHFYSWTRFTCRKGINVFECFDFEALRWLQLHIRNASESVKLSQVGVRRRLGVWPHTFAVECGEPALQRLFDASMNTLNNSAQETVVDGMGRERQQYSGDVGHQLRALRYFLGETRLPARFLRAYSEGLTLDGYFLDAWPGYDRLARIAQRQVHLTSWGPLLDHGVGFVFDCWQHYLETGDLEALRIPYPRLLRFVTYLAELRREDGLLPVEGLGVPSVWIDHDAYLQQRHKQCAFNLYTAAMFEHALAPIARAFGEDDVAEYARQIGQELLMETVRRFWSHERQMFVNNLPWLAEEKTPRLCDRSLATSILYGQCPEQDERAAIHALVECPAQMGLSFPANAGWRYWALAKSGRVNVILADFRQRWATMASVIHNNTLQEMWDITADTTMEWSHCPVVPLYVLAMSIVGLRPLEPGFARYEIHPQLTDMPRLQLTLYTPQGALHFRAEPEAGGHRVTLDVLESGSGELILSPGASISIEGSEISQQTKRVQLQPGQRCRFWLPSTLT